jgi:hypothetical protein
MGCVRQSTVARARGDAVAAFIKPDGHLLVDSPCPDEHAPERNGGGDYGHNHKCHTKACLYAVADLSRSTSRRWTISLMGTRRETSGAKTPA